MMRRRSARTGLPTSGAARFGRSRTRRRDNIGPMPRQNDDNSAEAAATMIAQHPVERERTPDQPRQDIAALFQTGVSDQAARQQSP
jgi:hypothetical protein